MKSKLVKILKKSRLGKTLISLLLIPTAKRNIAKFKGKAFIHNKKLVKDLTKTQAFTDFRMNEYFWYDFSNKTTTERQEFVSDKERVVFSEKVNPKKNAEIFNNKVTTYEYFKEFYKRSVCCINGDFQADISVFEEFLKNVKGKFIVKTVDGSFGKGVKIVAFSEKDSPKVLLNNLYNEYSGKLILEEVIVQDERTAIFHPQSLNSVRMPTIRYPDGTIDVIHPFFRVGRGDSIVDNAGAGGIICALDVENGKVIATADELGKKYDTHPETNQELVGFTVPCWQEAVEFSKNLASVLPDNVYSAWDIALTDNGWVMVEGNYRGQFVWQIPTQKGFRKELQEILQKIEN